MQDDNSASESIVQAILTSLNFFMNSHKARAQLGDKKTGSWVALAGMETAETSGGIEASYWRFDLYLSKQITSYQ